MEDSSSQAGTEQVEETPKANNNQEEANEKLRHRDTQRWVHIRGNKPQVKHLSNHLRQEIKEGK